MKLVRELGIERGTWFFTIEGKAEELEAVQRVELALSSAKLGVYYSEGNNSFDIWGRFGDGCPDYSGDDICISGGFHIPSSLGESFKAAYKAAKSSAKEQSK